VSDLSKRARELADGSAKHLAENECRVVLRALADENDELRGFKRLAAPVWSEEKRRLEAEIARMRAIARRCADLARGGK
jgi:hypothetical protein